jgi:hypothetical protein
MGLGAEDEITTEDGAMVATAALTSNGLYSIKASVVPRPVRLLHSLPLSMGRR